MSVGARLRRVREQLGKTQREVALLADMTTTHLSDLECGRKRPLPETVIRLARGLGIRPGQLFEALYCDAEPTELSGHGQPRNVDTGAREEAAA